MNDSPDKAIFGGGGRSLTFLAGVLVLVLALGALLWPGAGSKRGRGTLLIFDSSGDGNRVARVYDPLLAYLTETGETPLDLEVVGNLDTFQAMAAKGADFILCPDGLGLNLQADSYVPVVVGRRSAPRNLRPRGVLVYRKSAGLVQSPWLSRPSATVCGDSVSLTATGMWRRRDRATPAGPADRTLCAWGPDPYDHSPALHAARLGAFDYALVRQWDADRFFAEGLLSPEEWGVEIMTVPVPDIVLFAGRTLPAKTRLAVGEGLSSLGRGAEDTLPVAQGMRQAVLALHLSGFNLLVDPDFDLVRRNFSGDWPTATD